MKNPEEWLKDNKPQGALFMEEKDWTALMFRYAIYYHDRKKEEKGTLEMFSGFKLYEEIINHLNKKTGRSFRVTPSYQRLIKARIQEKYTFEDFKKVIDIKHNQWKDSEMKTYLRPTTLFQAGKFDGYLQEYGSGLDKTTGDNSFNFKPTEDAELL